eukprot:s499_g15.t2
MPRSSSSPVRSLPLGLCLLALSHAGERESRSEADAATVCSHKLKGDQCLHYLPAEAEALQSFLQELQKAPAPKPGSFEGRGIVMSGGPMHVLQALANLEVLRTELKSGMPVEFWHAFELEPAHCEALASRGAECRQLQVPGVYRQFETVLPSIMASSFREILWLDTDITLLYRPEELFDSPQYQSTGALFWPDHWSYDCPLWGESSWPGHVALKLLQLKHNASDMQYAQEHETGHFLIDRERHWKPICLANYLASRDFFTRVLHGYKDVFRLAFLKLNASNWLSPVRPGLVGGFLSNGLFFPQALVQFWPAGDLFGTGPHGRNVPLYIHQKKEPGNLWVDLLTFETPLGTCSSYTMLPFDALKPGDWNLWLVGDTDVPLAEKITTADLLWDVAYKEARDNLMPLLSEEDQAKLLPKKSASANNDWHRNVDGCRCNYDDNLVLFVLTVLSVDPEMRFEIFPTTLCDPILLGFDWESCPIGFTALAVLCSQHLMREDTDKAQMAKEALTKLVPSVEQCLAKTAWPLKLEDLQQFANGTASGYPGDFKLQPEKVAMLGASVQRCLPLSMSCWTPRNRWQERDHRHQFVVKDMEFHACRYCCDKNIPSPFRKPCFDSTFTEQRCCKGAA